ncbi:MAG: rane protein-like protein [Spartobacteria bacterium]|nr:rane protein-like protein [Spartobacteria bacterium]
MQTVNASPLPTVISEPDIKAGELLPPSPDSAFLPEKGHRLERLSRLIHLSEWIAIAVLVLVTISLHVRFVSHVGGLWRDEANSVQLATLPTFTEVCRFLDYDSFPVLFFSLVRVWAGIFGPANDAAFRCLGLIIGLGLLSVLWISARAFGARLPVLAFALVGLNPMLIRYGDSTRAYGLGMLLILLTFATFWRLVNPISPPSRVRILSAAVMALLSVQCLYYNSVLLLAIAAGAIAVALRQKAWRTVATVLGIGILSATSLLPYWPMMHRMQGWTFIVKYPVDLAWLWGHACKVIGSPDPFGVWLWTALVLGGLTTVGVSGGVILYRRFLRKLVVTIGPPQATEKSSDESIAIEERLPAPILFAAVALTVAIPAYFGFLWVLSYRTQPWYYITLAAFVACALDVVFGAWSSRIKPMLGLSLRAVRLLVVFILLCLVALPAWEEMPTRHTNVDLLAAQVRSRATKDDVVLVSNWEYAVSLNRYYHGPAEVFTLPPIAEHRFHRYDLAVDQMMKLDPLQPVFARLTDVLRSGHRVFLIGWFPSPRPDVPPPVSPKGYRDISGRWHGARYDVIWLLQTGHFIQSHATQYIRVGIPVPGKPYVQEFENLDLNVAQGWR